MAEVDDEVVPTDGLCNYSISFSKMEVLGRGAARFTFDITDKESYVTSLSVDVNASNDGLNGMMARAHLKINNILRQLLYINNVLRKHYEKENGRQ